MPVRVTLDRQLKRKNLTARELAAQIDLSETQMSMFRSGKVRGIRFVTLAKMCAALDCKPGDLLDYDFSAVDLDGTNSS